MATHNVALYAPVAARVRHQIIDRIAAATPFYPSLAMTVNSTQSSEDYDWLGQVPGVREWLGDRKFKQLSSYEFNIKNRDWEQSIQLPKNQIDDGNTGYFNNLGQMLADEAAYHPDELLSELMNNAGAIRCYDGQFFFDTDHESQDSGIQSNLVDASSLIAGAAPTPDEIRAIVNATMNVFLSFKRDNGKAVYRPTVRPITDMLLAVPAAWYSIAVEAYATQLKVASGAAVDNWNIVAPQVVGLQGLDNVIDVYRTGQPLKPFVFQDRQPLGVSTKGEDDREFKDIKVMADARYNMGVLAWQLAVRNTTGL